MRGEITVDMNILKRNVAEYKKRLGDGVKIIGVVKADGYGHGAQAIAENVNLFDGFAVATTDEAIKLRTVTDKPVLLLGFTHGYDETFEAVNRKIAVTVWNGTQVDELARAGDKLGKCATAHIAVDTGMNRIGLKTREELNALAAKIEFSDSVMLGGVYSHFFDGGDDTKTELQRAKFIDVTRDCPKEVIRHIAASCRALDKNCGFSAVRLGIGMYGYGANFVEPCLSVKGEVVRNVKVTVGETVGYGGEYTAEKEEYIATLSLGYADGISRLMKGGEVLINGKRRKIVGNVCMDYCFALSDENVRAGDEVVFIGRQGDEFITAEEVAKHTNTIAYETLTGFKRIPRRYIL